MRTIEDAIIYNKHKQCKKCGGVTVYTYSGTYQCEACGHEEKDDFGKVKDYIEKNGPSPAIVISTATGVKLGIIEEFLKTGRVEIPDGSPIYIKCENCRTDIRYGRLCPECARALTGDLKKVFFNENVGEKPKVDGRMRFLDSRNKI